MASDLYDNGLDLLATWTTDTEKALLVTNAYVFSAAHHFVSDITNELTVGGYTRQTLGSKTRTVDGTNHLIGYTAANPAFGTLTAGETIGGMVVYKFVTVDADSILIGFIDLTDTATSGVAISVSPGTNGFFYYYTP